MAVLTETVKFRGGMRGIGLKYLVMEVDEATAADTVTVDEVAAIKDTVCVRLDTGAEVPCTEATNVVTIGAGPANTPLLIVVTGW